ncbi:hypothetical protein [Streptococcus marmotae]|nr:hypothetical protein [Streptococcus marmotae]
MGQIGYVAEQEAGKMIDQIYSYEDESSQKLDAQLSETGDGTAPTVL